MQNRFEKHSKFEALLKKLPLKNFEREVAFNPGNDMVTVIHGMAGRGEYPLEFFLTKKDEQAEEALKGVIEHCLGKDIEEILKTKETSQLCKLEWQHDWADYIGITETYKYCKICGRKQ